MAVPTETTGQTDLRLSADQVDNYGNAPYYKLGLDVTNEPKAYIDTEVLQMMYQPLVYNGSWQSNLSVVMKIEKDTPSGKYSFQNIVVPNRYLVVNWQNIEAEQEEIRKPNASLIRSTTFEGTILSEALFERITNPSDHTEYAYRQIHTIGGTPFDFYLTPQDTSSGKIVKAIWDNTGPAGKYYFTVHPTSYPN